MIMLFSHESSKMNMFICDEYRCESIRITTSPDDPSDDQQEHHRDPREGLRIFEKSHPLGNIVQSEHVKTLNDEFQFCSKRILS